jgi:hypothetical protein
MKVRSYEDESHETFFGVNLLKLFCEPYILSEQ